MKGTCPVKSSNEWKDLVVYAGSERRAEALYLANNSQIPSIEQLQQQDIKEGVKEPEKFERFLPLITKNTQEITRLNKLLADKQSDFKKSKDKPKLSKEIQILKNKISNLEDTNVQLKKNSALEDVEEYANEDLDYVQYVLDNYESEGISQNELSSVIKSITLWQKSGDFSATDHLFFTPEEMEALYEGDNQLLNEIADKFSGWKRRADVLSNKYKEVSKSIISNELFELFGNDVNVELDKALQDVNWLFKNTIDISEIDHQVFKLMSEWTRKANYNAQNDVKEDFGRITKLFDKLRSSKKLNRFIDLVQQNQSNTDSRKTGDLTSRFTQLWHDKEKEAYYNLRNAIADAESIEDSIKRRKVQQQAYKDFRKNIDDISITVDVRKLFFDNELFKDYKYLVDSELEGINTNFTKQDRIEYIQELKNILGEEGYNHYYEQVKDKLEQYKYDEQSQREYLEDILEGDMAAIEIAMDEWKLKFNPFWNSHYSIEGHPSKKIGNSWASSSKAYISTIAKRYDEKGQDLGFYDNNFNQLVSDPDLKETYEEILSIFQEYSGFIPAHETKFWQVNTLPTIEKSILETFTRDGMISGLGSMWKQLQESTKTDVYTKETPTDVNEKELQLNFLSNNDSVISDYIIRKTIEYKNKNKDVSKSELRALRREWRKDIQNELAIQKSWDIEKITKAFMLHTATFKHKSKIEDSMKICRNFIDELVAQQSDSQNSPVSKLSQKLGWRTQDLDNIKDMVDHYLNNFFGYDIKARRGESVLQKEGKKRKYSKEDKATKIELENSMEEAANLFKAGEITEDEYLKRYSQLQSQLNRLGRVTSWINIGDNIIKYIQIKGIGWNVFSAFSNRGFGVLANIIDSADGRRFNQKQYRRAASIMKHSLLKNVSFHQIDSKISQKIRAAMTKLDVLKESKNEIFEQKLTNWNKKFKFINPYNMQSRGEYMNQGEVMIGIMLNTKVLVDGKESNLWDAMNEDGSFNDNVTLPKDSKFKTLDDLVFNTKSRVDEGVRTLHGNYDFENNPLLAKRSWIGRAASQFRTWAFMGFYDRFGKEQYSEIAGFEKKGRYLSYGALFKEYGTVQGTIELTKNLLRKLAFQNTQFDELLGEGFSEADAANLRKNLQELVLYGVITGLGLLLRAAAVDDDEERDPTFLYLTTFWINQLGRLQTDILFYTNPVEFEKLQRQALPVFTLVTDFGKLLGHGTKLLTGQTTDIYETGIYVGKRKSTRYMNNVLPLINQINKLESVSKQIR